MFKKKKLTGKKQDNVFQLKISVDTTEVKYIFKIDDRGFPGGSVRHSFDPWARKISRAVEQLSSQLLSLCSRAWELQPLSLLATAPEVCTP